MPVCGYERLNGFHRSGRPLFIEVQMIGFGVLYVTLDNREIPLEVGRSCVQVEVTLGITHDWVCVIAFGEYNEGFLTERFKDGQSIILVNTLGRKAVHADA